LSFVDDEHGFAAALVDVGEPLLAQRLAACPAIVGREADAEEVAELAVEVGVVALGAAENADLEVASRFDASGTEAQRGAFSGTGVTCDGDESAIAQLLAEPKREGIDLLARGQRQVLPGQRQPGRD
jgi:hypothetical protein